MPVAIQIAHTEQEKEAVYRLRYAVYTREMHLFRGAADHERRILTDPEDAGAQLLYAAVDGKVAGAVRLHGGRDGAIPAKYRELYEIDRFCPTVPQEKMVILTRFTISEEFRSGRVPYGLMQSVYELCLREDLEMGFCDCVPHLIHLYQKLGWRRYLNKSLSDPEFGIQIPLCLIAHDVRHLESIGSPLVGSFRRICGDPQDPQRLDRILQSIPYTGKQQEALEQDWSQTFGLLLEHRKTTVFDGLGEEAVQSLVRMGELIECRRGQAIIRAGTVYKDIFIILEGKVEIRLGDMAIAVLGEGELFGEIAFLLGVERTTNVVALSDSVRVVSLREQDLGKLIHAESALASKLLLNISRLLCLRLVGLHHLLER
jgi:hypothetical protein